jgi:hypothetical protein
MGESEEQGKNTMAAEGKLEKRDSIEAGPSLGRMGIG